MLGIFDRLCIPNFLLVLFKILSSTVKGFQIQKNATPNVNTRFLKPKKYRRIERCLSVLQLCDGTIEVGQGLPT